MSVLGEAEILRFKDVCRTTRMSRTTLWRLRRSGAFPPPIQLSPGLIGWRRSDLEAWFEERRLER